MNPALIPWITSAVIAAAFAWPTMTADAKSAKQVFAEVARSVVVVLAADSDGEVASQGSGVVVGDNEVATNCHVLDDAASVSVRQAADAGGGESYRMSARVLARDDERDLCLLFVEELSVPPAAPAVAMGLAKGLSVGEEVFAIGAPKGLELSMSRGIVSQLRGIHGKRAAPLVQTDAAISPGSSGGGLFNEDGELVGITTFKWKGENLNFAIPAEWVGDLREQGREQRQAELQAAQKRRECSVNPNYECVIAVALLAARNIDHADSRAVALRGIAEALAEAGDAQSARDTFAVALSVARSIDGAIGRVWALGDIAQAEAGDMDGAFATARSIGDAYHRVGTLRGIAVAQAGAGDMDGAFATARSIDNAADRASAFRGIAVAQAGAGDMDGAFATARSIDDAGIRAWAFRGIAVAQAGAGDAQSARDTFAVALSVARSIDNAADRASAFRGIAVAQAEAGDMDGAFATAQSIGDAYHRVGALHGIAETRAEAGYKQTALKTFATARFAVQNIHSAYLRAKTLSSIATGQAKAGSIQLARDTFAAALSAARSIDHAGNRARALRGIAEAQAGAGDMDGAFATARNIDDAGIRAWAFRGIAVAQAEAGDAQSARDTFAVALSVARSIDDAILRAWALGDIAVAQAEAGDFRGAMKTAMGMEDDDERARALAAIAKFLAAREKK